MAINTKPLTNTEVKQARPKEKEYNLCDGGGLSLRVKTNGSKLWLLNYYRPFTKKRANLSLGMYPALSLADARKLRQDAKELLVKDIDPKTAKDKLAKEKIQQLNNTLELVAKSWFSIKKTQISKSYGDDVWRSLELHILPIHGKQPITEINAPQIIETLKPIASKGTLETVKRLSQRLNEIMIFAVNTGLIHSNPLSGIRSAFESPTKKSMPSIKPEQLPELIKALNNASIKRVTKLLIEWQLHTMVRPSESAMAKWSEIDLDNNTWNIPAERMKKKRPHTVPLTPQTIQILEDIRPISGHREYIFPADRNPKKHCSEQTANMALKRMGFKDRLVAHGLRSLASTTLNEQGFDSDVIESALAHIDSNEVRRAYNRAEYLQRREKMMCWWSAHIDRALITGLTVSKKHLKVV